MWDKPLKKLEKVDNPTETDETEDEKNELHLSLDIVDRLYRIWGVSERKNHHFFYREQTRNSKYQF